MENKVETTCSFTFEELQYMLVMLTEGQDKINGSKAFQAYQSLTVQESIIGKVRNKCWELHQKGK